MFSNNLSFFNSLCFDDQDISISSRIFIALLKDRSNRRLSSASDRTRSWRIILALNSLSECAADFAARYLNLARCLSQLKLLVGRFSRSLDVRLLIHVAHGVTSSSLPAHYSHLHCSSTPTDAWGHIFPSK